MPTLELPQVKYKASYLEALVEFQKEGRWLDLDYELLANNFELYLQLLQDKAKGIGIPKEYVPQSQYWVIDQGEYAGGIYIRHPLTDALRCYGGNIGYEIHPLKRKRGYGKFALRAVLPHVKKLGIKKALLTCYRGNIASQKIIEGCGGVFQDEIQNEGHPDSTFRYWLALT